MKTGQRTPLTENLDCLLLRFLFTGDPSSRSNETVLDI